MKRIIRDRYLTPEEKVKYRAMRSEIAAELPELVARHHRFLARRELFGKLQTVRTAKGVAIAELPGLNDRQKAALAAADADHLVDVPVKLLRRYPLAVGKRLVLTVVDA